MKRILVVDDSRSVHAFVDGILKSAGYELEHVYNGLESVERLEKTELPSFDAILMDWEMPTMTGPEAVEKLIARGEKAPILMMTSKSDPEDLTRMLAAGASEYIMKPFTHDVLLDRLKEVWSKKT